MFERVNSEGSLLETSKAVRRQRLKLIIYLNPKE